MESVCVCVLIHYFRNELLMELLYCWWFWITVEWMWVNRNTVTVNRNLCKGHKLGFFRGISRWFVVSKRKKIRGKIKNNKKNRTPKCRLSMASWRRVSPTPHMHAFSPHSLYGGREGVCNVCLCHTHSYLHMHLISLITNQVVGVRRSERWPRRGHKIGALFQCTTALSRSPQLYWPLFVLLFIIIIFVCVYHVTINSSHRSSALTRLSLTQCHR